MHETGHDSPSRLLDSVSAGECVQVPLDHLHFDSDLQPRVNGLDEKHVAVLMENSEAWPPLEVVKVGNTLVCVDGFHRAAAAMNLSLDTVNVRLREPPVDGDLRRLAFELNLGHGRPLSLADRRAEAERIMVADALVSNLEVSRRTGLSPTTIAKLREQLEKRQAIASSEQRVSTSGVRYTPSSIRLRGELPADEEPLGGRVCTADERRRQRTVSRYLERLSVSLADSFVAFEGWETPVEVAEACRLVLGEEEAIELGANLGPTANNVWEVAIALGYEGGPGDACPTKAFRAVVDQR